MTGPFTEDTLKSLTKPQINDLFPKIQEQIKCTISKLADEMRNLNANFKKFELDVEVCRKLNDALMKQVAPLEHQ